MRNWKLSELGVEPHQPQVISSTDDARTIVILLPAGEHLREHQVHERALLVLLSGELEVSTPGGEHVEAGPGHLFEWDPNERHQVSARSDALLLLILTPWPGDGHPGTRG